MARSVVNLEIFRDSKAHDAMLLPKEPYIDRIELAAETRSDYTIPAGTRRVILQYACPDDVYVRVYTAADLTMPAGAVSTGEAPFINPHGLGGLEASDKIQFISASAGAVHIICAG